MNLTLWVLLLSDYVADFCLDEAITRLVYKMPENSEKHPSQFLKVQGVVLKCLFCQSKLNDIHSIPVILNPENIFCHFCIRNDCNDQKTAAGYFSVYRLIVWSSDRYQSIHIQYADLMITEMISVLIDKLMDGKPKDQNYFPFSASQT